MLESLMKELAFQTEYLQGHPVETLYFGGGTPSALPSKDIRLLIDTVRHHFVLSQDAEVTLEANPDDINVNTLEDWKEAGINRLSIGIQAFQDELLRAWNRSHSAQQALKALDLIRDVGFENISADLIYGGPGLTDSDWESNIQRLIDAGIPHISSYALTVETGTALHHQVAKGKVDTPDDEQANRQYAILQERLNAAGILQYEVSNFGKPGFESRHNMSYWSGAHYLGIGPSAHSFNTESRQWNIAHNIRYIDALTTGVVPFEKEMLTLQQQYHELVMTGLRTTKGIDSIRLKALGEMYVRHLEKQITGYIEKGMIVRTDEGHWVLQPAYFFFADGIAADLFLDM